MLSINTCCLHKATQTDYLNKNKVINYCIVRFDLYNSPFPAVGCTVRRHFNTFDQKKKTHKQIMITKTYISFFNRAAAMGWHSNFLNLYCLLFNFVPCFDLFFTSKMYFRNDNMFIFLTTWVFWIIRPYLC